MTCTKCHLDKPLTDFHRDKSKRTGLANHCKPCRLAAINGWHRRNPYVHRRAKARRRSQLRTWVLEYLKQHPCLDCGEPDPIVLEFDHVRGEKVCDIAAMIQNRASLARLMAEVSKCEVRCANCHRRQTVKRRQQLDSGLATETCIVDEKRKAIMKNQVARAEPSRGAPPLRDPTPAELDSPRFNAVWNAIKGWDISRDSDRLYSGATGTDVCTILDALEPSHVVLLEALTMAHRYFLQSNDLTAEDWEVLDEMRAAIQQAERT